MATAANRLIKDKVRRTRTVTPESTFIPGTPYKPAYYSTETKTVCQYTNIFQPGSGSSGTSALDLPAGGTAGANHMLWVCSPQQVTTYHPPVPATPGYWVAGVPYEQAYVDFQLGWNSGARSIGFFTDDGHATFHVRASVVGAIVGLNTNAGAVVDTPTAGYNGMNIPYAFSCSRGAARIVENGAFVLAVGSYSDDTVFKIERDGTDINYYLDDVLKRTVATAIDAPMVLESSLYSGDDEVFNPALVQVTAPDLTEVTGTIDAVLPPLGGMFANGAFAELRATLPPLSFDGVAGLAAPAYATLGGVLPMLDLFALSKVGTVGWIDATLPALDMLAADHPYGELVGTLPPIFGSLWAVEGNNKASFQGGAAVDATMASRSFLMATFTSGTVVTSTLVPITALMAEMLETVFASGSFVTAEIMQAVMRAVVLTSGVLNLPGVGEDTFVLNTTSKGTTSYSGYAFNSFATIGGKHYGANSDGLYLLEGDTDDGEPVRASISFGVLDFGTATKVTVSQCYVGMSGEGNLFVKVIAEGREFIYKTRSYSPELQQQRVTTGKGLRTNYVTLEIYNEEGASFELDTVEFHVADLTRRI